MPTVRTMQDRITYLVHSTGRTEEQILAEAIETGLAALCAKRFEDAFLAGEIDRSRAIQELGLETVEELDYARRAIERDVAWGLKRA